MASGQRLNGSGHRRASTPLLPSNASVAISRLQTFGQAEVDTRFTKPVVKAPRSGCVEAGTSEKASRGTSGKRVFTVGGCQWCGGYFVGVGAYCSTKCSAASKFQRRSSSATSFNITPRKRSAIYERDEWTCQLCKFPVERDLHYLNNWAPSLDHIIPRSTTLIPDHSPSNLQLAHRMCNSMKGDGSNMTEAEFLSRITAHFQSALAA